MPKRYDVEKCSAEKGRICNSLRKHASHRQRRNVGVNKSASVLLKEFPGSRGIQELLIHFHANCSVSSYSFSVQTDWGKGKKWEERGGGGVGGRKKRRKDDVRW